MILIIQIILTVWLSLVALGNFVKLTEVDDYDEKEVLIKVFGTILRLASMFGCLCFIWGWFGF